MLNLSPFLYFKFLPGTTAAVSAPTPPPTEEPITRPPTTLPARPIIAPTPVLIEAMVNTITMSFFRLLL